LCPKFDFHTGLGNQFLANIRECDAIVHMVRCFENDDVIHVDASIDPVRDVEVIELELALADLQQVEKRMERAGKDKKTGKAPPEEMVPARCPIFESHRRRRRDATPL
jgi:ribosome-binding ATPase YchF (GTP1/OBG family)